MSPLRCAISVPRRAASPISTIGRQRPAYLDALAPDPGISAAPTSAHRAASDGGGRSAGLPPPRAADIMRLSQSQVQELSPCPTKRRSCNSRRRRRSPWSGKSPPFSFKRSISKSPPRTSIPMRPVRRRPGPRFDRYPRGRAHRVQEIRRPVARGQPGKSQNLPVFEALSGVHCGTENQVSGPPGCPEDGCGRHPDRRLRLSLSLLQHAGGATAWVPFSPRAAPGLAGRPAPADRARVHWRAPPPLGALLLYDVWPLLEKNFSVVYLLQECGMYGLLAVGFGRSLRAGESRCARDWRTSCTDR